MVIFKEDIVMAVIFLQKKVKETSNVTLWTMSVIFMYTFIYIYLEFSVYLIFLVYLPWEEKDQEDIRFSGCLQS